ncbi:MAG: RuvB-like domain-containing protein [Candidatus Nanohaloarchaea archaeon]
MVEIEEVEDVEFERIGSHSHVNGLGLDEDGKAKSSTDGLVGQETARESAGHVANLARKGKLAGRAVLFAGPPGTGKTAIAVGMANELGEDIPFVQLTGSEIFSADKDKNEVLKEKLRRALGVRIQETRNVYEGKVVDLDVQQDGGMNPFQQQAPREASVTLETEDDKRTLRLGRKVAMHLQKESIMNGDVVRIDAESGQVQRLGKARSDWEDTADESVAELVPVPSGYVEQERDFTHTLTLHHMDKANAQRGGGLAGLLGTGGSGINEDVRDAVNRQVKEWIESGKAELLPGVLFIDEVHMLDIEAISFLNRAMEREFAPIMVLASNRGETEIRGTDLEAPHGLPLDLLDRLLIINTEPYTREEIREILEIRAEEEEVSITGEALQRLSEIGDESSLRYAVQLIAPAEDAAELDGSDEIQEGHVETARNRFIDVERSTQKMEEYEDRMLS